MINHQSQATPFIASPRDDLADRVAVLLAGYGEVQSCRDLSRYNQAASKYIASQFVPIPDWLYPLAGKILALEDLYNFGVTQNNPQYSPFKLVRYIPSFATESAYVDLMVHQLEETLTQTLASGFFASRIGIILTVHGRPDKVKGLLTGVIDGQVLAVRSQLQPRYPLISIGWVNHDMSFINWSQPDLKQSATSLIKAGAQTILNLLVQEYKFLHDRVQQAVYALIDESHKQVVHLQIGRNLLENTLSERLSEQLFEIVDHLNYGIERLLKTEV
ncbi:MAG: hypothetical protein V7K30_07265 [Nostoc sp.]